MRGSGRIAGLVVALVALGSSPASAQVGARAVITGGPSGEVAETTAEFTFERSSAMPLTSFECRLDGAAWTACESPLRVSGLLGGTHVFGVRLVGALADQTPDTRSWTVAERSEVLPPPLPPPVVGPVAPRPPVARKPVRRDASGCAYGANRIGEVAIARLERATVCVLNAVRRARGLRPVRYDARLRAAAARHARDMVRRRYFAHTTRSGTTASDRIHRTGYMKGVRYWSIGEILAWTVRPTPTPAHAVEAWMRSPPHRRIVLHGAFNDVGVGIAAGSPQWGRRVGGTFAAEFGRRG